MSSEKDVFDYKAIIEVVRQASEKLFDTTTTPVTQAMARDFEGQLQDLTISISAVIHDLESTRRENEQLRKLLEGSGSDEEPA